jgi:hypothetical protein
MIGYFGAKVRSGASFASRPSSDTRGFSGFCGLGLKNLSSNLRGLRIEFNLRGAASNQRRGC